MFLRSLFPHETPKRAITAIALVAFVFTATVLFTPAKLYSRTLPLFQFLAVISFGYGVYLLVRASRRRREGALAFLLGFLVLIVTATNDILYADQSVHTGYWAPFGVFVFIFSQAFLLSQRFSRAMTTVEAQRRELIATNRAYAQEIQEREQAEGALKESENKYRTMFEDSLEPMSLVQNGKIVDVNPAWLRLHGFEQPQEVMGRDVKDFIHPEDRNVLVVRRHAWPLQTARIFQVRDLRPDGTVIYVEVYSSRITLGGRDAVLATIRDITAQKRAEEEKNKLQVQLQQAHKMKAIGTLAGGIVHDFNNILAAIMGYAELADLRVASDHALKKYLREVLKASHRAKDLVRQILAFSRQTEIERKPVQIAHIVQDALKLLRASLPTTIEIRPNIDGNTAIVEADPTQIHQVLMNLATNAHHAMEAQGGVLTVGLTNFNLTENLRSDYPDARPGSYIKLAVSDTGHGMDPATLERIFDPFFTTKDRGQGTGMGLSVVHGIVKSHAGAIRVDSEPGKGTRFEVLLPAIEAEVSSDAEGLKPLPMGMEKILFVDDELPLALLGKQMLEGLGYQVETRTNPIEALETFRGQPQRFDLVITDKTMPHMTGFGLAVEMKRIRPNIPIILCTGFSELKDIRRADTTGIGEIAMKPLEMRDLAGIIRKLLEAV
ncbi:MAG: PAS domain S-box protein [Desulfobacterales bacterium]|nr:MAG: PAS domain S-box protein [Desulfobacterales bacterium]